MKEKERELRIGEFILVEELNNIEVYDLSGNSIFYFDKSKISEVVEFLLES